VTVIIYTENPELLSSGKAEEGDRGARKRKRGRELMLFRLS
jgi:hypothetical protein